MEQAGGSVALVNDLDLNVSVARKGRESEGWQGSVVLTSMGQFRTNDAAGGTHPDPRRDRSNNVERVEIPGEWARTTKVTGEHGLAILVSADRVVGAKGQTYALVVVGPEGMQVVDLGARVLSSAASAPPAPRNGCNTLALAIGLPLIMQIVRRA